MLERQLGDGERGQGEGKGVEEEEGGGGRETKPKPASLPRSAALEKGGEGLPASRSLSLQECVSFSKSQFLSLSLSLLLVC